MTNIFAATAITNNAANNKGNITGMISIAGAGVQKKQDYISNEMSYQHF